MRTQALSVVAAAAWPLLSQPKWTQEHVVSPPGAPYRIKGIAAGAQSDSVWILAANTKAAPEEAELWRVDSDGGNRISIQLSATEMDRFEDVLCATADGSVYLVGWSHGKSYLLKTSASGETMIRPLALDGIHLLALEKAPNGLLLVGDGSRGAFAARVDETGRKIWSIDIDKHPLAAIFSSGTVLDGGSTILAGNMWDFHQGKIGMGIGHTLLLRVDARGNIIREQRIPGRIAIGARTSDGNFVVVDDPQSYLPGGRPTIPGGMDPNVYGRTYMRLQAWSPDLKPVWTSRLPEFHMQFLYMAIRPAAGGGVVLFGTGRGFDFIASEYDAQGSQVWTINDPGKRWGTYSSASSRAGFVFAHPVYGDEIGVGVSAFKLD